MLPESRLFRFLDEEENFAIYFLEAQKLISDLVVTHTLSKEGLEYFRKAVLTAQPIMAFLKPQEGLGFYIDSDIPYFRLKIETNFTGAMRTLLLPSDLKQLPERISGKARVTKLLPGQPYTSLIQIQNKTYEEVINQVLKESYQVDSIVKVSETSDQSLMLHKLPTPKGEEGTSSVHEYQMKMNKVFNEIFSKAYTDESELIKAFEEQGMRYLQSSEVKFYCPCSKERMIRNMITISKEDIEDLYKDTDKLEIICDYCKSKYYIEKEELIPGNLSQ